MAQARDQDRLRVFFFPMLTPGHMLPIVDMAILFSRHGASPTVITTPGNLPLIRPTINHFNETNNNNNPPVRLLLIPFPSSFSGAENLSSVPSSLHGSFMAAVFSLRDPLREILKTHLPDCLVSDAIFPWTADDAVDLGIPRLVFHGPGAFPLCVHRAIELQSPHDHVSSDSEPFEVNGLKHQLSLTRFELSAIFKFPEMLALMREAEGKSLGAVVNSFVELEPDYTALYCNGLGPSKAWFVGPVSRSHEFRMEHDNRELVRWMTWLDSRAMGSVMFVCFGSLCEFSEIQLREVALGLELSGRPFIWAIKEGAHWALDGFEERTKEKGMVIRGWAPQVALLGHVAVGGFVTHCGWNSIMEGVAAGKVMATWPLQYEQFVNERFVTEALGIGVRVKRGGNGEEEKVVTAKEVAAVVKEVMGDEQEAHGRRRKVQELSAMAKAAVEEGGSSYEDVRRLFGELAACREARREREKGTIVSSGAKGLGV
ncbi:scopoletin glucosyltransferase-like [Typha angustifolia]|uniref:scopoletin glucosyltransferase-like n=1 Tax=Typha angustifolia TaxID=59011 RepID=UPI003C300FD7